MGYNKVNNQEYDKISPIYLIIIAFLYQMKNAWQLQRPIQQDYQQFLFEQLNKIKQLEADKKTRLKLLTGMIYLLKQKEQIQKVKAQENMSTSFSEDQSNFTVYENQIEELEDRILQKRAIKFQINQEIQGVQQDLFQMEKTVDTKRQYDQMLRKQIQAKMKKIERKEQYKQHQTSYLDKSLRAVTGIFKGWLY